MALATGACRHKDGETLAASAVLVTGVSSEVLAEPRELSGEGTQIPRSHRTARAVPL